MTIREEVREKFGVELEQVAANYVSKVWKILEKNYEGNSSWAYFLVLQGPLQNIAVNIYLAGVKDLAGVIGRKYE